MHQMKRTREVTFEDLSNLVEQKVLEFLGDPDAGLELHADFKQELKKRLKESPIKAPHRQAIRKS